MTGARAPRPGPGVLGAWRIGAAMLSRYAGLALLLYALQLALAGGAALVMARLLEALFAHRPLFDAAVEGDLAALAIALRAHPWLPSALAAIGLAAVGLYLVLSWFLLGGLINVLLERPVGRSEVAERFGRGGALTFFPYLRLALWSLGPWLMVAGTAALALAAFGSDPYLALRPGDVAWPLLVAATPATLLAWVVGTAVDYARIDLSRHIGLGSGRALLRGFRFVFTCGRALPHALLFYAVFVAVTAGYVAMTTGRPLLGAAAAVSLFALRQALSVVRFAARFALIAGQVELCQTALPPVVELVRKR